MNAWRATLAIMLALASTRAEAHAFGARYDLPLPLGLYLAAAGAAVAASFLGAVVFSRSGRTRSLGLDIVVPCWTSRAVSTAFGSIGVAVLAILLGAAFFGPQDAVRNLATIGIWVIWWVGFLLIVALVVSLWPQIDPFRRLAALAARLSGKSWEGDANNLPAAAGLLAPAGLLSIAWVELISDWSEDPFSVGILVVLYLLVAIAGGLAYGRPWFEIADPLGRIFTTLGRLAPLSAAGHTTVRLRPPGEGLLEGSSTPRGEVALVTSLIGIVLFDGLSETPAWAAVLDFVSQSQELRPLLLWMRDQGADLLKVIRTLGLLATVATFYATYWLLIAAVRLVTQTGMSTGELARLFVSALLPIAVAYHLSHYASYLFIAGQLVFPAASDPFALGWDIFGTRDWSIDISVIGARHIWWIAFSALIAGHSLSVLVGHRRALQVFGDPRQAVRSQVPMTLAMIGLTVLSLWILSQPITV
jgi:hypothetical protein